MEIKSRLEKCKEWNKDLDIREYIDFWMWNKRSINGTLQG